MATGASSYFSGSTIMPSQLQHAGAAPDNSAAAVGAPSPAKSRNPRFAGCIPTTVRHLARSYAAVDAGGGDHVITMDGIEVTNVRFVGRAVNVVNTGSSISFTLDDGTGKIALNRWFSEDQIDALEAAFVQNGAYLKVQVSLIGFQTKQQGLAHSIRSTSHSIQTSAPTYAPFSSGVRDHQVHLAQVNQGQFSMAVQPNASTHVQYSGGTRGQHNHFTPQPNQFSAYPGTGGQQHDSQGMILEALRQPDILDLEENGVHADKLARRAGVPKAQIMETGPYLDLSYLYYPDN